MEKTKRQVRRVAIGISGGLVVVIGIIAIPYPGPGWLIVFAGLAILATEFAWAQRVLDVAKGKYDEWQAWLARQSTLFKVFVWSLTALIVVVTIWLLNGYGLINDWFNLGLDWVKSPLF